MTVRHRRNGPNIGIAITLYCPGFAGKRVLDGVRRRVWQCIDGALGYNGDRRGHCTGRHRPCEKRLCGAGATMEFREASCTKLPFDPASFDCVVSFRDFGHIAEASGFIAEVNGC